MAAGIATIKHLIEHEGEVYPQLERTAREIADGVAKLAQQAGVPLTANRVGSMFTWFFTAGPVTDFASASTSDSGAFARFHRRMMASGVWLPPSQFEAAFVSTAHGPSEVEQVLEAAHTALAE
jgi:glutamate-1-semialdehyde 2,1-aminomutase